MRVVRVDQETEQVYLNLAQAYEGEFSGITDKRANADGMFPRDTQLGVSLAGFLC